MDTNQTLINLGKTLTADQFITFLSEMSENQEKEKELPYLLAGLEPHVFSDSLRQLSPALLSSLQRKSVQEPLYYLLTQIFHEGEALYQHLQREIQLFEESLALLQPDSLSPDAIQSYLNKIKELSDEISHFLPTLNAALTLIWQTDRIDLIEKLSNLKEMLLQLLTHAIGSQGNGEFPSTGLYAELETACSTLYDSSLKDSDAAIEGLTRLSIWFHKDYHELGLPLHDEGADAETADQTVQADRLTQVQKQLERLNIGTVKGLKQAYIFSKEMLKSYIEKNRHLLS